MSNRNPNKTRPLVGRLAKATREGRVDRREFFALASALGVSAASAYALIGLPKAVAHAEDPRTGGTLRIGIRVLPIDDPRKYDWTEKGNVARTFVEPLVLWEADGTFSPRLLTSWEVSDDAQTYMLNVRKGVTWTNGDKFTADDVIFNIRRMADASAEGNSMAARLVALRDGEEQQAADDAIEKVDDFTVRLNLRKPDISLIPSFGDYPALCVHPSFTEDTNLAKEPIGTGPFELVEFEPGIQAVVKRRESGSWWGGEPHLDRVEFIDFGTDTTALASAFESGEIDMNDETSPDQAELFDSLGLVRRKAVTANTMVSRMNMQTEPYTDKKVRNALQLACNNEVVLKIGIAGLGTVAENHHVAPVHPEYAELPKVEPDAEKAMALLEEAGHRDTEFELISVDEGWLATSSDAIAAQLRSAGANVKRTLMPGSTFWNDWTQYPFSTTSWGGRPLGVQVYALAYRTGEAWNESGHSNPEFDTKLAEALGIFDADERRPLMEELEKMLQDSGVIIQPYWNELIMHHTDAVKGYERHPLREIHLEKVWLHS